jgi:hypothetical protein
MERMVPDLVGKPPVRTPARVEATGNTSFNTKNPAKAWTSAAPVKCFVLGIIGTRPQQHCSFEADLARPLPRPFQPFQQIVVQATPHDQRSSPRSAREHLDGSANLTYTSAQIIQKLETGLLVDLVQHDVSQLSMTTAAGIAIEALSAMCQRVTNRARVLRLRVT